jgi:PAS domain-containing protein
VKNSDLDGKSWFHPFFATWMTDDRSVDPRVARVRDTTARGANIAEEGRPTRNVTIVEQIEAEKALRESEARFRELADNISQFAWTADQSGWIYRYNKRWHDYTGTTLKEMEGWGWHKVHHPEHVDRVVEHIRQSFETGTPWEDTSRCAVATAGKTSQWLLHPDDREKTRAEISGLAGEKKRRGLRIVSVTSRVRIVGSRGTPPRIGEESTRWGAMLRILRRRRIHLRKPGKSLLGVPNAQCSRRCRLRLHMKSVNR